MASITRPPDGRWRAGYRDPEGRERARRFARKADAERWLATIRAGVVRGGYVDPAAARTTFKQYAERWRAQQPHRPGTTRPYERMLRLHVYPITGSRRLNAAVDDGIIATSPRRRVIRPAVEHRQVVPWPLDGVGRAAEVISPRRRALVLLSVGTGGPASARAKALGLTADRVNLLRREVTVDRQLVKVVGKPPTLGPLKAALSHRLVPLPSSSSMLWPRTWPRTLGRDGLISCGADGQPLARAWLHRVWQAIIEAGLPEGTT